MKEYMSDRDLFRTAISALKDARLKQGQDARLNALVVAKECVNELAKREAGDANGKEDV